MKEIFKGGWPGLLALCVLAVAVLCVPGVQAAEQPGEPFRTFDARIDGLYHQANRLGDGMEMLSQQGGLDRGTNDSLGFLLALTGQQLDNVRDLLYLLRFSASEGSRGQDERSRSAGLHVTTRLGDIADSQGLQLMILSGLAGPETGPRAKTLLTEFSGYVTACRDMARDLAAQVTAGRPAAK